MKTYILRSFLIAISAAPVYVLIRRPWRFHTRREIPLGLFWIYLLCLFIFTLEGTYQAPAAMLRVGLERMRTGEYVNLVPFRTISRFFRKSTPDQFWINIISNVVIFIPWGCFLPLLWNRFRRTGPLVSMCLAITLFIEFYQLFIWRNTDIDDVILNFLGGLLGGLLYWVWRSHTAKQNP